MPERDYVVLMTLAAINKETAKILTGNDDIKKEDLLTHPFFEFKKDEIDFLISVDAKDISEFAHKTRGYWKD